MRVLMSGASGMIGSALGESLRDDGHTIAGLSRHARPGWTAWDPAAGRFDAKAIEGVDAVVHLAGRSLFTRWTVETKREMWDSRVRGARLLAEAIASCSTPPAVFVSCSAVGIYGDRGDTLLDERSGAGSGFLAELGEAWEAATAPASAAGVRVVHVRTGPVLRSMLEPMRPLFQFGFGGPLGSGRQWMSWIHLEDLVAVYRAALTGPELSGPVNAVAPEAVRNAEFVRTLGRLMRRPAIVPAPAFALRLVMGKGLADEALLASQRVRPARLEALGFTFRHPRLEGAMRSALDTFQ